MLTLLHPPSPLQRGNSMLVSNKVVKIRLKCTDNQYDSSAFYITYSALADTHPPAPLKGAIVER